MKLTAAEQKKVDLFVEKLGCSIEEAMELIEFDKEVNKMTVKEALGDQASAAKTSATEGAKATKAKPAKKDDNGYTPNQAMALELLQASKEFMTGKELSEASGGVLNSRGLGSVMKKLIEQGLVEKQAGSPVKYKFIGE